MANRLNFGGMAQAVEVFELVSSPPLSTGFVLWVGRMALPTYFALARGDRPELTLADGRTGRVSVLEVTESDATFCGAFT